MSPAKRSAAQKRKIANLARNAKRTPCRKCGQETWVGVDAPVCGLTVTTEVYRATAVDEVLARGGRPPRGSYELTRYGNDHQLDTRDRLTVRARPGEAALGGVVVLAHDCYERPRPLPPPPEALFDYDAPPPY